MQNFRSSFFLLLIVLATFAYIIFVDRHKPSTDDEEKANLELFSADISKVVSLKITSGGQTVALVKREGIWKIKAPFETEADPSAVQQVLNELQAMQSRRTVDFKALKENNSLEKSGLAPAATTIEFSTGKKAADQYLLLLGRKIFASDYVYARTSAKDDAPVHLISTSSRDNVDKKLDDLRSRVVFKVDRSKVDHIGELDAGVNNQAGTEYELVKHNQEWSLEKPLTARADRKAVYKWLEQIDKLRIKQFITEDGSNLLQMGLNTPVYQIWLQSADQSTPDTLLIGNQVPPTKTEVYAKRLKNDSVFTLDQSEVEALRSGVPNSRDRHIWGLPSQLVTTVEVEGKGKPIKVIRNSTGWTFDGNPNLRADPSLLSSFLSDLAALQTSSFVNDVASDLTPYGLDKPLQKVTLGFAGGKTESLSLLLGKTDKQGIYAKTSAEPFIYSLPLNVADQWPKDVSDWRDPSIFTISADNIKQLVFTPSGGPVFSYQQKSSGVFNTEISGQQVNQDKARNQVAVLALLRAVRWLGPTQPSYGLAKPVLKIEITELSPSVLVIGATLPTGNRVAQVLGQPDCFELAAVDYQLLALSPLQASPPAAPVKH